MTVIPPTYRRGLAEHLAPTARIMSYCKKQGPDTHCDIPPKRKDMMTRPATKATTADATRYQAG
jgi:hypothetical protein